jgi:hypothetical protein
MAGARRVARVALGLGMLGLAALVAGCAEPQFKSGDLFCAPGGACPEHFHCASDGRCWAEGTSPALADGGAGGPSQCATSKARLCDGFEAAAIDAQWLVNGGGASASLDSTRAFRGTRAIHVHTDSAAANSMPYAGLTEHRTFPISGTVWIRVWAYLQSPFSSNFDQVINVLDSGTGGASFGIKGFAPVNNDYVGSAYRESMLPVPRDKWTCLRMSVTQVGTSGEIHLFVDDKEASDAQISGATVPKIVAVAIGADFLNGAAMDATDMWLDEIIVDDKPVACSD